MDKKMTRRNFLRLTGMAAAAAALAACTPAATGTPTQVVEATKEPEATATVANKPTEKPTDKSTVKPTEVPSTEAPKGGTLVIGCGVDIAACLDTIGLISSQSIRIAATILDPLVSLGDPDPNKMAPIPWLAEKYESPDGKVWTFTIRKDVRFHDGTVCDAEAVKFNFDRWMDKDNPWRFQPFDGAFETAFTNTNPITEVKVVDAMTLQVTQSTPSAVMLYKLPYAFFAIASPTAIQKEGVKYGTPAGTCVGTGPFMFKEWLPNDKITVVKNPNWWNKGLPLLDAITWRTITDDATRLAPFIAGDFAQADLTETDLNTAVKDINIVEYISSSLIVGYIAFQQATKPFDSVDVRWAVAHAINRQAILETFFKPDKGDTLAKCFMPPSILGSNPDVGPIEFSPEKARERLAKAGLPDGFKTEFWYYPVTRSYFPDPKGIADAIAADLARVGIEVELKTQDFGAYLQARLEGKFPMWMCGWGSDDGDADNFLGSHFNHPVGEPNQEDGYNNDRLAQLLIDGVKEPDLARREAIYKAAEQIVHDDMARLPFVWIATRSFFHKSVKGIVDPLPIAYVWLNNLLFNHIWIEA